MKIISHRGNMFGPDKDRENCPEQVLTALAKGYDVEVDLWAHDQNLFLGHDEGQYPIQKDFLENNAKQLWIHCKNLEALYMCEFDIVGVRYFWHQSDDFALTSDRIFWTYPGQPLTPNSILVMPEIDDFVNVGPDIYGICSDHVDQIEKIIYGL